MNKKSVTFEARERLDKALARTYPEYSRAYLARLINADEVLVNGRPQKTGFRLKIGDEVRITVDLETVQKIEDIDLPILYEDKDVLVINKPSGVISHSRGKYWYEPSVASFIRQKTLGDDENDRAGIVHRLDRATSGVMICAKNEATQKLLQKQFADRTVRKTYVARISNTLPADKGIIDAPIERNPKKPSTFRVGANGKPAQTEFERLENGLVQLTPQTGRTHQIRVHLKYLECPIDGDELYEGAPAERLMLHAQSLEITISGGSRQTFNAPLPEEFMP